MGPLLVKVMCVTMATTKMACHTLGWKEEHWPVNLRKCQEVREGRERKTRAPAVILNNGTISVKGRKPQPSSGPSWRGLSASQVKSLGVTGQEPAFQKGRFLGSTEGIIKQQQQPQTFPSGKALEYTPFRRLQNSFSQRQSSTETSQGSAFSRVISLNLMKGIHFPKEVLPQKYWSFGWCRQAIMHSFSSQMREGRGHKDKRPQEQGWSLVNEGCGLCVRKQPCLNHPPAWRPVCSLDTRYGFQTFHFSVRKATLQGHLSMASDTEPQCGRRQGVVGTSGNWRTMCPTYR